MLDLARETVWGLYALHYLANRDRLTGAAEISRHGRIPRKSLAPILRTLRAAGLLRGRPGHGYALAKPAAEISVAEVARVLENADAPAKSCMERFDACATTESCALAPLCREANERAQSAMRAFTVADLRQAAAAPADCTAPRKRGKHAAV